MAQPAPQSLDNFDLVCSLSANNAIPVHKYKSRATGITVVVAEIEGPVANGYFCLATEAHDDDGLPHTLEHLIFLGSEDYPFKGVLDLLANRCLASGTNAWTDTDHTCYTITTAGSEGILALLPIYLDHILYPTLTDTGYVTEVHHVDGDGRDGGVVYTEMQGRENSGESRVFLELVRGVYPGQCGYKSEAGGVMRNIRESTSIEKVRNYHHQFYRPENLCIIIAGCVKPEEVLKTMAPVEQKILSKGNRGPWERPWQSPIPPLRAAVDCEVLFPSDEEANGMVYMGWRGPPVTTDIYGLTACSILLKYLTDTAVSPLTQEFVEVAEPYANKVSYSLVENAESLLTLQWENVPVDKLGLVRPKLEDLFEDMLDRTRTFDMDRLETVINRHRLECLSHLESVPHDTVAFILIGHMLYGNTSEDLNQRLNIVVDLERMMGESEEFWKDLLKRYFVDGVSVTVRGRPSIAEQQRLAKEEEERVMSRRTQMGNENLKKLGEKLIQAADINDTPPPDEMLTSVPIPSLNSISFHSIESFQTKSEKQHPLFSMERVPIYAYLDHLRTSFVYILVMMDTSGVETRLRKLLPILLELLLESPIERDGVGLVPYEEVVAQLERDTVMAATRLGLDSVSRFKCGPFSSTASLMLQVEPKKYEVAIDWIREILFQTKFTENRVKIIASKIINNVAETKRDGNFMVYDLMKTIRYTKESNHYAASLLRQAKALNAILNGGPQAMANALADLEALRRVLTRPENMAVNIAANLDRLSSSLATRDLSASWSSFLPKNVIAAQMKLKVTPDWQLLKPEAEITRGCIAGMGSVESCFLCMTAPCLSDFNHPDLAPILVFFQYLTQLEGPMWKQIRGKGLAYSYNVVPRPNEALLFFSLYRSSNVVAAYATSKQVIEDKMKNADKWDSTLLESAKSSVIFEIIHREKSIGDVVAQSVLSYFKGVSHDFNRELVKKIANVQIKDLEHVGKTYVPALFDPKLARATVVCHPQRIEQISSGLKELGLDLITFVSIEESFLND